MDADRFPLITTHTDITLNRQYVEENADRLRDDLVPFVAREIHAITGLQAINIQTVMDLLMDTFKEPEKYKDKLFAHLKAIGVDHPRTFYRFVYDFASADQSLDLYDSNSRYK
jgi:mRNA-degrading endonuclease YafQ of YafQ-DinJ toxin-antitoxin module